MKMISINISIVLFSPRLRHFYMSALTIFNGATDKVSLLPFFDLLLSGNLGRVGQKAG
jgi:hypothetical protein